MGSAFGLDDRGKDAMGTLKEMPNWTSRANASAEDGAEWDRFLRALEIHAEQAVVDLVVEDPVAIAAHLNAGVECVVVPAGVGEAQPAQLHVVRLE